VSAATAASTSNGGITPRARVAVVGFIGCSFRGGIAGQLHQLERRATVSIRPRFARISHHHRIWCADPPPPGEQLRRSAELDELDLQLVTALQTTPRADWHHLGQLLGVSASTAARRWARLNEAGLAWLGCHPLRLPDTQAFAAFIEVDTMPGKLYAVAAHLADDPHVFDVIHLSGSRDLLVVAGFADHASLARYLGFRLGSLDGVLASRAQIATTIHTEPSRWRADRLPAAVPPRHPNPASIPRTLVEPDAVDLLLMTALGQHPRLPTMELASRTGLSATTVARRRARPQTGRLLAWRCDVARVAAGWPVSAHLWGRLAPERTRQVAAQLVRMREVRLCASTTGPTNLFVTVWLRSMCDLQAFLACLATHAPDLTITDRAVSLWQLKLGGHLLDPDGRRLRSVPLTLWPDQQAADAQSTVLDRLRHNHDTPHSDGAGLHGSDSRQPQQPGR
jgi:DNA-binding Lrp family transcriptional regulator